MSAISLRPRRPPLSVALPSVDDSRTSLECSLTVYVNTPPYPAFFITFSVHSCLLDLNQTPRSKAVPLSIIAPGLLKGSWPRLLYFLPFLPLITSPFFALGLCLRSLASSFVPSFSTSITFAPSIFYNERLCVPERIP